ncbi:MAG TPA: hypothetical protein VKB93_24215, partial [Thermoanaerobaculia bacterium]|nr:hypothetical protein [Thermoanaerobaculia bacterium]
MKKLILFALLGCCAALAAPAPRSGHAAVYDTRRRAVILLNGDHDLTATPGDVWAWFRTRRPAGADDARYLTRWNRIETSAPAARTLAAVAYDSTRRVLVMQGGLGAGETQYGDT